MRPYRNNIETKDIEKFKKTVKEGAKVKVEVVNVLDANKRDILSGKIVGVYPYFVRVQIKAGKAVVLKSINYIDLYQAKQKGKPVEA